jgi:ABC-type transport system involved in multi-copper enzyme maturation permease subunit
MSGLIGLETRLLLRNPVALLVAALMVLIVILGVANGRALMAAQQDGRALAAAEAAQADARLQKLLAEGIDPVDAIYLPFRLKLPVTAPLPPLADASAGRAAYDSYAATASIRSRADTLLRRTHMANPALLTRGSLDIGFAAIVIAPLLLIALGHGVFAADRDSGTARLVLAQAGGAGRLLIARSVPRLALVAGPLVVGLLWLLLIGPDVPGRDAAAASWLAVLLLYLGLWWALILWINSFRISAETAALALVSAWAMLVLVVPALISAIAQIAYPPPSRYEQIAASRAAEISATQAWDNDHKQAPEGDVAGAVADLQRSLAINSTIEAAVQPINSAFDAQLARQQSVIAALALLSPARVAGDALAASAGTDSRAALAFRQASSSYLAELKRPIAQLAAEGRALDAEGYRALPRFTPPPPRPAPLAAIAYLALLFGIVSALAARGYARLRLD